MKLIDDCNNDNIMFNFFLFYKNFNNNNFIKCMIGREIYCTINKCDI